MGVEIFMGNMPIRQDCPISCGNLKTPLLTPVQFCNVTSGMYTIPGSRLLNAAFPRFLREITMQVKGILIGQK